MYLVADEQQLSCATYRTYNACLDFSRLSPGKSPEKKTPSSKLRVEIFKIFNRTLDNGLADCGSIGLPWKSPQTAIAVRCPVRTTGSESEVFCGFRDSIAFFRRSYHNSTPGSRRKLESKSANTILQEENYNPIMFSDG